jgi:hypothetical protein
MTWRREAMRALGQGATREQASDAAWQAIGMAPPATQVETNHDTAALARQIGTSA